MDEKTKTALKDSVEHWGGIVNGYNISKGTKTCALCQLFHNDYKTTNAGCCEGCPISDHTGHGLCKETPYRGFTQYFRSHEFYKGEQRVIDEESRRLAQDELDFLQMLYDKSGGRTFHIGQQFWWDNQKQILAQIHANEISLISLEDGNRVCNSIRVSHSDHITESELKQFSVYDKIKLIQSGG